jgi:hypothetical protein
MTTFFDIQGVGWNSEQDIFWLLRLDCWFKMEGLDLRDPIPLLSCDSGEPFLITLLGMKLSCLNRI